MGYLGATRSEGNFGYVHPCCCPFSARYFSGRARPDQGLLLFALHRSAILRPAHGMLPIQLSRRMNELLFLSANPYQAHRLIAQIVLTGSRVIGRAFTEAYRQAQASSRYAAAAAKDNPQAMRNISSSGLTLDEACKILNVKPPQGGKANMDDVYERFKRLYDLNEPKRGGSFYLQSKILRARERIELEVREAERKAAMREELKKGWKPKMYRE